MFTTNPKVFALAAIVCLNCTMLFAADSQTWTVTIDDDAATLRTNGETEMKFIVSTLRGLRLSGFEKLSVCNERPEKPFENAKTAYSVSLVDGHAQIRATSDLPMKHLKTAIDALEYADVNCAKVSTVVVP
jgi:hypothetical protein